MRKPRLQRVILENCRGISSPTHVHGHGTAKSTVQHDACQFSEFVAWCPCFGFMGKTGQGIQLYLRCGEAALYTPTSIRKLKSLTDVETS
jgi:hypothetical protein